MTEEPPSPQLRITLVAEVPDQPGQEYTAAEMLLALTNGLGVRGVTPSLLRLEFTSPSQQGGGHRL
ncbi:MAG: hypothetical protein ACLP7F_25335 [Acidimicrobiales bacterium]